ncbi:ABC transporter substrate-binding protein [Anaerospora hongkongensis]|uniref:ABC transporter substrate-binding protein n=1 Tax=Anaerospora hongkongensis TaxID=244830 RepID=UPI0028986231|nr:cobalamin-binding protein [Anaerospora hongkongensis]
MNKQKWLYLLSGLLVTAMFLAPALAPKQQDRMKQAVLTSKPQRIVSMSPGNTEIVFALGAGDRVVGVTSYSDYPEEAKTKPTIGGYHAPDVEKIVSLAPDVVFAMTDIQAKYIQILRQAGIRVVAVEPKTLPEILNAIDIISEALGEEARGRQLHQELAGQLDQVRRQVGTAPAKRTFLEVWDTPLLTVGRQSFIHDLITQAGGINVSADKNVDYTPCDIEQLYAYNPEVYVVLSHSRDDIRSVITNPNLAAIQAVKTNQVFSITDDLLQRPGPRSFTGLVKLAEILHPQEMKEREIK